MDDLTGQVLSSRYRVEGFIGRGGMADVYKIWDEQRAAHLALKVLHSDLAEDAVFLRRFKREAHLLERLQHPNIVRFYGLEEWEGLAFILMDYIDGLTLRKEIHLSKGRMRPARILQILRPVCSALYYAHQLGMIHCDIKPANIIIHRSSMVYLADFGIARLSEATTQTLAGAGTPAFMAPEQLLGRETTPASDIYALGVVLFEMISGGERPFTGEAALNVGSTTQKIVWEKRYLPPPSPRKFRPDISNELEQVVLRCLARSPIERYSSTLDLLHALEEAIYCDDPDNDLITLPDSIDAGSEDASPANRPGTTTPDEVEPNGEPARADPAPVEGGPPPAGPPSGMRGLFRLGLAITLLAILASAAIAALNRAGPSGPEPTRALASSTVFVPPAALAGTTITAPPPTPLLTLTATAGTAVIAAPQNTSTPDPTPLGGGAPGARGRVAFASDRSGTIQIWVMGTDGGSRRQLTKVEEGACQPAWSPDGTRIAYITPCRGPRPTYPGATIQILDLESGETITPDLKNGGFDPTWSPDGSTIAFTSLNGPLPEIHILDVSSGAEKVLAQRVRINANPAWSPDGEHIIFTGDDLGVDVLWLMRKDGGSQEILTQAGVLKYFSQPAWSPDGKTILATMKELNVNVPILVQFEVRDPLKGETPVLNEVFEMADGSYSPDGRWIIFGTPMEGRNLEIMRVSLDGEKVRMTNHPARDFQPAWTAD